MYFFIKNQLFPKHIRSRWAAMLHDAAVIPVAWLLALWLRFNLDSIPPKYIDASIENLIIILPIQFLMFAQLGLYRGIWRFASVPDLVRILKSVVLGIAITMAVIFFLNRGQDIPRSIPVLYGILLVMLLTGPRLLYRWAKDHKLYFSSGKRVLIVGSGNAGEMLARDILRNRQEAYHPVAFVDDNESYIGREIHGIPILDKVESIPSLVDKLEIDLIMLAVPTAKPSEIRRIVNICEKSNLPFRSVPHLQDLIEGRVNINELREISIEDLLGRDQVALDWERIASTLSGKCILLTGAGGSIGSELCRQIARLNPKRLILVDHSEFNLFQIEKELSSVFPNYEIAIHLGSVSDQPFMENVFHEHRPQIVFHAAAYKHVPMLESQIRQAMQNNILGTKITADCASKFKSDTFVFVSTDKAVNPANVMGATKRSAEIYCQNLNNHSDTDYLTVRFGNVLGSAGSVIPIFREQLKKGGPLTVTDPRMERYFMTIPEACQLIMQTTVLGKGGEIFVLDMGEPVKISYLAEQMILLSGKIPGEDIQIEYIGLRPGEKLYEELFHEKESLHGTQHPKVLLAKFREVDWNDLQNSMEEIATACKNLDEEKLKAILDQLVPEHANQIKSGSTKKKALSDNNTNVISLTTKN
jgi:FlaA1/EpsC-like NDP-sugar epimerase